MKKIGILVSGGGTNAKAILDACDAGKIKGKVVCIGSDNPRAYGLERARLASIPTFILPYAATSNLDAGRLPLGVPADFREEEILEKSGLTDNIANRKKIRRRAIVEAQLLEEMKKYKVDVLVLAGFMKILSPYFLDKFQKDGWRVINIHPALLPAFPGTNGYEDAWNYGVKVHGCTVHFVDYGEDTGPIIGQKSYNVETYHTFESFQKEGLEREWQLFPECLSHFCEDRLIVENIEGRNIVRRLPYLQEK